MQTIKINETRTLKVQNQTINAVNVSVMLESSAVNNTVAPTDYITVTDFDPTQVNLEINLTRGGRKTTLINAHLGILGHFFTIKNNRHLWTHGLALQVPSVSATHLVERDLVIDLGGHYNLKGSDEINITMQINRSAFGSNVSAGNSNITIEENSSIGIETGVHQLNIYSIDANQQSDGVNLGDNVMKLALISFEKDWTKSIFRSCTLQSDRLDWQANEQMLNIRHWKNFDDQSTEKLLDALATNVHPLMYPHSKLIHDVQEIDSARISFTMNSVNVVSSQNFVVWSSYSTDMETLQRAAFTHQKHEATNLSKVPISPTV